MATNKKKNRVKAQREAKREAERNRESCTNPEEQTTPAREPSAPKDCLVFDLTGDDGGIGFEVMDLDDAIGMAREWRGEDEPGEPKESPGGSASGPCAKDCDGCASPCITVAADDEFDRWMEQSSNRFEEREQRFREMVDTPAGKMMLHANGHRRPALLLPPDTMFTKLPRLSVCGDEFEPLRDAWLGCGGDGRGDPAGFVACDLPRRGLLGLWNTYAYLEQFYMDVWSLLGAEASRDSMTAEPPKDSSAMAAVLRTALEAFRIASEEQRREDASYIYAFDNIHIASDQEVESLLQEVASADDDYCAGEGDERGTYLHFTEASGSEGHTMKAAGYAAAVEVLRANGIGCEQWSRWD